MENAQRCRAMALICRQHAVLYPEQKWKWLGQAERWEHLAEMPYICRDDRLASGGVGDARA